MGNSFRSGLIPTRNHNSKSLCESTASKIETIFDVLRANPKIAINRLEALLLQIPKVSCKLMFKLNFKEFFSF